jgi:hypothetical protein
MTIKNAKNILKKLKGENNMKNCNCRLLFWFVVALLLICTLEGLTIIKIRRDAQNLSKRERVVAQNAYDSGYVNCIEMRDYNEGGL